MAGGGPPAVVLGLSPTGLCVARELGRAGVAVLGAAGEPQPGSWSRYLSRPRPIIESSPERRLDRLMAAQDGAAMRWPLIPTSDQDIAFVGSNADRLTERFVFQPSYRDGSAALLLDKARFYAHCRACGVPAPAYVDTTRAEFAQAAATIPFPCLVKPTSIHRVKAAMAGRKLWVAGDAAELARIGAALPEGETGWLVQELIPGADSEIYLHAAYWDGWGEPHHGFTARKLRQYPPGFGSASRVVSAPAPEAAALSERLLGALGYRGIAAAEFKRDPRDGKLKAIEINPRPGLWFSLVSAAGRQIVLAAYRDLSGEAVPPERPQRDGVLWTFAAKDAYSAAFYRLKPGFALPAPEARLAAAPAGRARAVFAWDDPLPAAADLWNGVRKGVGRALARIRPGGRA